MVPTDTKEFAQAVDRLFAFARSFSIRDFDAPAVTRFYRDALAEVPVFALNAAVDAAIRTWKWPNLPKPADLKELALPTWTSVRAARDRVWTAQFALGKRGAA